MANYLNFINKLFITKSFTILTGSYFLHMQSKISYLKQGTYKIDKQNSQMCLGKGSFGKVYKAFDNVKNTWVAIKQINIELLQEYQQQMKEVILNEINVTRKFSKKMNSIPCQYLVKQYDCFRTDNSIYIVMEYCQNGTLFDELKIKKTYSQEEVIEIARQLLEGLMYLQKMDIAHRDLKPQNIFITKNQQSKKVYKIGDFGFAARKTSFNDILGTYQYMAPQIFNREEYTSKVDIWSLGITLHQLLFNQLYYSGKNKWEIQDKIKAIDYKLTEQQCKLISPKMQKFLKLCLTKNKIQRPRASQLLSNQMFSKYQQVTKSVFNLLNSLIQKCVNLIEMAQMFNNYQKLTYGKKKTIFVQLYLLKFAYCEMNRAAYSISNKSNYISIPNQMFEQLIDESNSNKYERLNELSNRIWNRSRQQFTRKYEQFMTLCIIKYNEHDKQLINKVINNEPYQDPVMQIFINEVKKWIIQLSNHHNKQQQNQNKLIDKLRIQCQKIVQSAQQHNNP